MNKKSLLLITIVLTVAAAHSFSDDGPDRIISINPSFGGGQMINLGIALYPNPNLFYIQPGIGFTPLTNDFALLALSASLDIGFYIPLDKQKTMRIVLGARLSFDFARFYNGEKAEISFTDLVYNSSFLGPIIGFEWEIINNLCIQSCVFADLKTMISNFDSDWFNLEIGFKYLLGHK